MRGWRVFAILVLGALTAAALASGQLAAWADAHADRPGGEALAAACHAWNDLLAPLDGPRTWLHSRAQDMVDRRFRAGAD